MAAVPDYKGFLKKYLPDFARDLQSVVEEMAMILSHENLSSGEYSDITNPTHTNMKKAERLITSVISRGYTTFEKFCEAAKIVGHNEVEELWQKYCDEESAKAKKSPANQQATAAGASNQSNATGVSDQPTDTTRLNPKKPKISPEELTREFRNAKKVPAREDCAVDTWKGVEVLIETVNNNEFYAVILQMDVVEKFIRKTDKPTQTESYYYFGKLGNVPVAVIQTAEKAGERGIYGSFYETVKAISFLPDLKYIFCVGVCGIVQSEDMDYAHVVVSAEIYDYSNIKFGGTDREIKPINRAEKAICRVHKFYQHLWTLKEEQIDYNVKFVSVMSAPFLIASAVVQRFLLEMNPDAKAFEMEGAGVYSACKRAPIEVLIIKGVSDFANADKQDDWQAEAAMQAVKFLSCALEKFKGEIVETS